MAELEFRAMSETLVAAASTFALFALANIGLADYLDEDSSFMRKFVTVLFPSNHFVTCLQHAITVFHIKSTLAENSFKICTTIESTSLVEKFKFRARSLVEKMDSHGTIAIIILVPIYIKFPASALASADGQLLPNLTTARGYQIISDVGKELKNRCPLELRPAAAANYHAINTTGDDADHNADANTEEICMQVQPELNPPAARPISNSDVVADTTSTLVDEELDSPAAVVLRLPTKELQEREVLLRLGLAPTYKELSFLRSRNKFQTLVTGLQAGGYMLTVLQRLAQNLGVSPVEALVTFLSVIMCLQLLIELYACGHYQRPLLLHLNARQFHTLCHASPSTSDFISTTDILCLIVIFLFSFLISGVSMYYFLHYRHSHLLSSIPALLFFLAHLLPKIRLLPYIFTKRSNIIFWAVVFWGLLYASSIILAVVATVVEWKVFREANQKAWYTWILPHVSS